MELFQGFLTVFSGWTFFAVLIGTLFGMILGAIPGLTSTMALAILAPLTFGFDPIVAICMLMGIYIGGIAGGSISAICLNIPGTPASAATAIDGYCLSRQGESQKALNVSFLASAVGGLFSGAILITLAPYIAKVGLKFSSPEYFALGILGISIILSISGKQLVKGLAVALLGFMIATIGIDPISGFSRYTFENSNLTNGISYIPALIGLFGLSEVFSFVNDSYQSKSKNFKYRIKLKSFEWKRIMGTLFRSSSIGTFIGAIPGAGADIASWASYDVATRFAKKDDKYGKGELKGVVASEAANNANVGGALIPMMTFGIPGDGQTAMLIAFLLIQGLEPGPLLFQNNPDFVWAMFASVLIANVLVFLYGISLTNSIVKIISQPTKIIYPCVIMFCLIGSFAVNNNIFDIGMMCLFGVIGFLLKKFDYPIAPLMLALILAPMIESNLRRGLVMYENNFLMFFQRPIFLGILALGIILIISTLWLRKSTNNIG
ncbi:tripartite tricarboxylate transporter permease [Metabacillus arenae]|uniref:Tripartite tricarboxylate transporter permease n=1 Tax=Metabacillus arenae TaxID=2771434 RepID=A0A926RZ89_9BACI|nr:tripartite tricarboxylate transporter permease [Metabacillus arenae]MBD1381992.1 tripartite tricarboxylate transporter permease [Metabacillus arenae]